MSVKKKVEKKKVGRAGRSVISVGGTVQKVREELPAGFFVCQGNTTLRDAKKDNESASFGHSTVIRGKETPGS